MGDYYLAVDIGASSGRHILGTMQEGKLVLEEVYRFENSMTKRDGHLYWDVERLLEEILIGMKKCGEIGRIPVTMGIDTWAVDYVLLDEQGKTTGGVYGYRDKRTEGMEQEVFRIVPAEELYARTGIQMTQFNTIFQLMADKLHEPQRLQKADCLLMLPDYFNYRLTGVKKSEYTNATTGQLVNLETKRWDWELIESLGYPTKLFQPLTMPGTIVGALSEQVRRQVGYSCQVMQVASHDTASAVISVPFQGEAGLYISSGTWSLLGTELQAPICTKESLACNYTNEGGYQYRYRYLKNIMGLWMIQSVRREAAQAYSFAEICQMAEAEKDFPSRVNVNEDCFLAPEHMTDAIQAYCRRTGQPIPETLGQVAAVIYQSLAQCYGEEFQHLEELTGKKFDAVHIVGGGSEADYLNRLTAVKSGKTVYAGPAEATAIGNLMVQMLEADVFRDLQEARKAVFDSFGVKTYKMGGECEQAPFSNGCL